jgi:hypothetical protein
MPDPDPTPSMIPGWKMLALPAGMNGAANRDVAMGMAEITARVPAETLTAAEKSPVELLGRARLSRASGRLSRVD